MNISNNKNFLLYLEMGIYRTFQSKMSPLAVFSLTDIEKMFPNFVRQNPVNWQKQG